MRILYAALRTDYGVPGSASVEEQNFLPALEAMGHDVVPYDYLAGLRRLGYEGMNRELLALACELEPELFFCVLFEEQLDTRTVDAIGALGGTVTFNWFCDDHWRFEGYSRYWAPHFHWCATTDPAAPAKYSRAGINNVLETQWACNPATYSPSPGITEAHDVTFVGQVHGDRAKLLGALRRAGIDVERWGTGSENGRLSLARMVDLFASSRVSLNFSGASVSRRAGFRRRKIHQIKARPFEIAACGGFVLTEWAPGLGRYFEPGRELAVFRNRRDLVDAVRTYLEDDQLRRAIAAAGRARVLRDHTYEARFRALFEAMGLPAYGERAAAKVAGPGR